MKNKLVLNFNDLELILGKSKVTIWRYIQAGVLPKPMKKGRLFIGWRKETIEAWLDECEKEAA